MSEKKVVVVGAGLVGSLLAAVLSKRGYKVSVYERRSDPRVANLYAGRSINLAMSVRGWRGLSLVGADKVIGDQAIPMYGRMMHPVKGEQTYQPYGTEGQAIYAVSRGGLNRVLMDFVENEYKVDIQFNHKCLDVDFEKGILNFETPQGEVITEQADLIFGADGAFSAVRFAMQRKSDRFNYSQSYIEHGYKELLLPAAPDGSFQLEKNALHIWPRGTFMLIGLPNPDGSFTMTLFFQFEGEVSFSKIKSQADAHDFMADYFPDALQLIPDAEHQFMQNPTASLVTVRTAPWVQGKAALIGDAAHAIVPFYGQGMNCGFEDCYVLDSLIEKHNHDWDKILTEFQAERIPNANAVADLAMANFVEMRDLVADPEFLLQKKIEAQIASKHPEKWTPLYTMVSFTHTPYIKALSNGKQQDALMKKLLKNETFRSSWQEIEDFGQWIDFDNLNPKIND
jgi:kynurenine 3-monooxygenase